MTCEELRDEYEAFALGVCEDPEKGELREHLSRRCGVCFPGVQRAMHTVASLSSVVPVKDPPANLRKRIIAMLQPGEEPSWFQRWAGVWAGAAACLLLGVLFFGVRSQDLTLKMASLQTGVAQRDVELSRLNEAMALLNDPAARQVSFGTAEKQPPRGRVIVNPAKGVLLLVSNLSAAPAGKAYQMWFLPKTGNPIPAGLFQTTSDRSAFHVQPGPVEAATLNAVAVTLEVEGGVPAPTTTPIIVAPLAGT